MIWSRMDENTLECQPYMIMRVRTLAALESGGAQAGNIEWITYLTLKKAEKAWTLVGGKGYDNADAAKRAAATDAGEAEWADA
jgi:hypothetical protein